MYIKDLWKGTDLVVVGSLVETERLDVRWQRVPEDGYSDRKRTARPTVDRGNDGTCSSCVLTTSQVGDDRVGQRHTNQLSIEPLADASKSAKIGKSEKIIII